MYDDILLATDGSDAVETAVSEAIDLAALSDATLHALSVGDDPDVPVPDSELVAVEEALDEAANAAVADVRQRAAANGVAVETAVRRGNPAEEILAHAEARDVDLVVLGTQGRSGLDRALLGSVAETVVRNADRPVLVEQAES